jgi:L-gulonolactone oxidase
MRKMILRAKYWVNFPMEVRFVAADDITLSPAYGQDVCFLGAYVSSRKWAPDYFADFEEHMRDLEGRPHWAKSFSRTGKELRTIYPRFCDFERIRRQCDPNGLFRNSFVDRVFAIK